MWRGPGQDPGGAEGPGPPSSQELEDLKDQFDQQQLLIAQLKEMLRKNEQTTVTQEKVEEYANTLTKMKARAKRSKKDNKEGQQNTKKIDTPASEKINLLRQQLEENKVKLAERGKSQKGIEDMVTQLKAQLDDSQTLINQTPLNLSLIEAEMKTYSPESTSQELFNILTIKDRRITEMSHRMQKLEANVLDLQENLKEKDSVIDARTKAITLMSENLSKKGKTTLDALDDTKLQMRKMQENFVELEQEMKEDNERLRQVIVEKDIEIKRLEDIRHELSTSNSDLQDKLQSQSELLESLQKGDKAEVIEMLNQKIRDLEELNKELEKSPQKGKKNKKQRSLEVEDSQFPDLQKTIDEKTNECIELSNKLSELQQVITEKENQSQAMELEIKTLQETLKNIEPKRLDLDISTDSNEELVKLKKQLDESNKNMIKVKAQHKAKLKELTKKIDTFKKVSDTNAEIVKLHDENSKLSQKIAELEEEKGALQLKILETSGGKDSLSAEAASELERQLTELSEILTYKNDQITSLSNDLEESKTHIKALDEKLQTLSDIQNVQVKSEINSIHLEEQMDKLEMEKVALIEEKGKLEEEKRDLLEKIEGLNKEKHDISSRLDAYIQENIELMDKLEKLSAEKVSSAESIEIVEGLTQQEKLELEAYQKNETIANDVKTSAEHLAENLELNESVNQLTEETSELLQKIELFTVERREVMDKMEQLSHENNQLNLKIKEIENNRDVLAETYEQLQNEKEDLDTKLQNIEKHNIDLETATSTLKIENDDLKKIIEDWKEKDEVENTQESAKSPQRKLSKRSRRGRSRKSPSMTRTEEPSRETTPVEETPKTDNSSEVQIRNDELSKDIEEYKMLIDIQRQEIQELKLAVMGLDYVRAEKLDLEAKLSSLQMEFEKIYEDNQKLNHQIKENFERIHEKDVIEVELRSAKLRNDELEKSVAENIEEINNYKTILDENKSEIISSSNRINDLLGKLEVKETELTHHKEEIDHLHSIILDLNSAIEKLEAENQNNSSIEAMSDQLQELKEALKSNIEQINEYEEELNRNSSVIRDLQSEIKTLNNRILETEHLLESKNDELNNLQRSNDAKQSEIEKLQNEVDFKGQKFHETIEVLKNKCLSLQTQISSNSDSIGDIRIPLENKIRELEEKNKEQLEKMKKIAANLKKKTAQYQELEQKYAEINEKWESELREKDVKVAEEKLQKMSAEMETESSLLKSKLADYENLTLSLENRIEEYSNNLQDLTSRLNAKNEEYALLHQMYTQNSETLTSYQDEIQTLRSLAQEKDEKITSLTQQCENTSSISAEMTKKDTLIQKLTQKAKSFKQQVQNLTKEATELKIRIDNLTQQLENQQYNSEINSNALQMKVKELELFIETQDAEVNNYKAKVTKLEDGLQTVEARRMSLERTAIELGTQLEEKTTKFEELNETEDLLEKRIQSLMEHDEIIEKHLQETMRENELLNKMHKDLISENEELQNKIKTIQERFMELNNDNEANAMLENENSQLKQLVANLENDKKHIRNEFEQRITSMKEDNDKNEVELQNQLEFYYNDHKTLTEKCERLSDQIIELNEFQELLNNDIEGYKQKLNDQHLVLVEIQQKHENLTIEYENKMQTIATLTSTNEQNEAKIQEFQAEIVKFTDTINKQKVDHKEIEELQKIIEERTQELENYQKENLQLKMSSQDQFDPFANQPDLVRQNENLTAELFEVRNQFQSFQLHHGNCESIKEQSIQYNNELKSLQQLYAELQQKYDELNQHRVKTIENQASNNINTFTWPGATTDDFIIPQTVEVLGSIQEPKPESDVNQNEDLLNKIKSLEFMLYNAEKDKEETLRQCETLSGELAKLLYARQESSNSNVTEPHFDFESEIVQPEAAKITETDMCQLRSVEFEPCKKLQEADNLKPIVEEEMQAKTAYLCFPEHTQVNTFGENDDGWGWGPEEAKLEQEHFAASEAVAPSNQFHQQINSLEEKIHVLEQARERHVEEIKQSQLKSGKLIKKLKEYKLKNEELASQLNKKSDGFDDLNVAIEDELKSQINSLEKKIKEITAELEKEKLEKSNLFKRVDTLTTANDRLVENKEKQDIEIMSWQQKARELSSKLEQFEWGDAGFDSPQKSAPKPPQTEESSNDISDLKVQISELTETLKDLTLDNEELQALLEEQRNLRLAAEKAKSVEPIPENMKSEAEYMSLLTERNNLNEELKVLKSQLNKLEQENIDLFKQFDNLGEETRQKINGLVEENVKLNEIIAKNNDILSDLKKHNELMQHENHNLKIARDDLSDKLGLLTQENQSCRDKFEENNNTIAELNNRLSIILKENEDLKQQQQLNATSQVEHLSQQLFELNAANENIREELTRKQTEIETLTIIVQEKDATITNLTETITELNQKLSTIDNQLQAIDNLNIEITNLKETILTKETEIATLNENILKKDEEYDTKLSITVQQLSEEWAQKVDQRGYDIAESWKMHLDSRENEFYQTEQSLRKEISGLEEKHNLLVNENNELRKNVDAEIRNEVDRISALQSQINEKQYIINELNQAIKDRDNKLLEYASLQEQYDLLKNEFESYKVTVSSENNKIIEENNKIILEKDTLLSETNKMLLEKEEIIKQNQLILLEKDEIIKQNQMLLLEKDELLAGASEKQVDFEQIQTYENQIKNLEQQIFDKENDYMQIRQQLNDKENLIIQLNQNLNTKNALEEELENSKSTQLTLQSQVQENSNIIENLNKQLENYRSQESFNNDNINTLQQQIYEYQHQLNNANLQLQQYYQQIEILNLEIQKYSTLNDEVTLKDTEIFNLNTLLNQKEKELHHEQEVKQHEHTEKLSEMSAENDHLKRRLTELENHYEEVLSSKDMDNQSYRIQLEEQVSRNNEFMKEREDFLHVQTELALKNAECDELKTKIDEQNHLMDEEQKQLNELREIIEEQVLKIQELQKELYEKSRNYDALIAEVDITHSSENKATQSRTHLPESDDLAEPVSRAELDLALYMLHQRDVRCEELTLELMQLLEERDTLQLKLSNALREKEQLRYKPEGEASNAGAVPKTDTSLTEPEISETLEGISENPLNSKLSELRNLSYRKDKTVIDEQERRRIQQFSIMQQHRDEASKLPAEAAARLVDASYTLSRDVQSPSKVLLNWLWGRSTPKVNNI